MEINRKQFSCKNDHLTIRGVKYFASNKKNLPIIMSHGFLSNQKRLKDYSIMLAKLGYTVYAYDFCGGSLFGKSDGTFSHMSLDTELSDLECVINFAKNDFPNVKPLLFGESQGGLVSCLYASSHEINDLIMIYPALCIPDDARKGQMMFMHFNPQDIDATFKCKLGITSAYPKSVIHLDIDKIISGISSRMIIIHGTKDNIVNISYVKHAIELAPNKSSIFYLINGGKHGFSKKYRKQAINFLSSVLSSDKAE